MNRSFSNKLVYYLIVLLISIISIAIPAIAETPSLATSSYFEDGIQTIALSINGEPGFETDAYLKNGQPYLPLKYLAQVLNIRLEDSANNTIIYSGSNPESKHLINHEQKTLSTDNQTNQVIELWPIGSEIYLPLEVIQQVIPCKTSWEANSMTVFITYQAPVLIATAPDKPDSNTAKNGIFTPVTSLEFEFSSTWEQSESDYFDHDYQEQKLNLKTFGTIFNGNLYSEGYFKYSNDQDYEASLEKLLWDYRTPTQQIQVGTVFLDLPLLLGFNSKIIGVEVNNDPRYRQYSYYGEYRSLILGEAKHYYQADIGTFWRSEQPDQDGIFTSLYLNYGLTESWNLGGRYLWLTDSDFDHKIYQLETIWAPGDNYEFQASVAESQFEDHLPAVTDQNWVWNHHWGAGPLNIYFDGYRYGPKFYPYNQLPLDLRGEHLGLKYNFNDGGYFVTSYQQYTDCNLNDPSNREDTKNISFNSFDRLNQNWDWTSQITYEKGQSYFNGTKDTNFKALDSLITFNQKVSEQLMLEYLYELNNSEGTLDDDNFTNHRLGIGFAWDNNWSMFSIQPSYYWIDDKLDRRTGYGAEIFALQDWAEKGYQTRFSYDYYRENGGEHRLEDSASAELIFNLPKEYTLTFGATRYHYKTDVHQSTDTRYYLTLQGGFGLANGRLISGIKSDELGVFGAIVVTVFNDANQNGIQEPGENVLSNIDVSLDGRETLKTDHNGQVVFKTIRPGIHQVDFDLYMLDLKYTPTSKAQTIDLLPNVIKQVSLGVTETGSVSGIAYLDLNNNHQFDTGDQLLVETKIQLDGSSTITTNIDGSYYITGLRPGTHQLALIDLPKGYQSSQITITIESGKELTNQHLIAIQ